MTPEWSTACVDWEARIKEGRSLIPFSPLYPEEAEKALDVFSHLRVVDAPGSPTFGESSATWVMDFVAAIFGSYDHRTGRRLIREFFLSISKKNGKSMDAAGIMLTALIRNWRKSAEFLILAPTIEVARNSYDPARDMVRSDPELSDILHVQEHIKTITHRVTGATLKVVAADNDTVSGKKATGVFVDELWLFGKRPNAENMLREACGGLVSRPEGFVIYATTQSDDPPAGVFKQKLDYFRDVRDGKIDDPRSLPVLYEWPKDMEASQAYLDPANFHMTNPNIGLSVSHDWLVDELNKAKAAGQHSLVGFAAKHLNVQIGQSLSSDRWAGADYWEGAARSGITLDYLLERCDVACVGIDGGGLDDLFGLCVVGRERSEKDVRFRRWFVWNHTWAHKGVLERRKSEASKLRDFQRAGELTIFDEMGDDIEGIVEVVRRVYDAGLLAWVGLDPVGIGAIVDAINDAGIRSDNGRDDLIVSVSQGYKLTGAIKTAERKLAEGLLVHGGQAIMAWAVGNCKVEPKGNAILITKQASGSAKIDPVMAMFDAIALMSTNPAAANAATPEILVL